MHGNTLGSGRRNQRARSLAPAFGLVLASTWVHAAVSVKIVPKLIGQSQNMFAFKCLAEVDGVPAVEGRISITTPA
jgi:hypothetical protein